MGQNSICIQHFKYLPFFYTTRFKILQLRKFVLLKYLIYVICRIIVVPCDLLVSDLAMKTTT